MSATPLNVVKTGIYDPSHGIMSWDVTSAVVKKYGWSAVKSAVANVWKDKLFCSFLALSVGGFGYVGVREYLRLREYQEKARLAQKARDIAIKKSQALKASTVVVTKEETCADSESDRKGKRGGKRGNKRTGPGLWEQIKRLLSIAIPGVTSYPAQLLFVQFFFLVLRTFITINCVKSATTTITKAISRASFRIWVSWLAQFGLWMSGGILVNSGLHFFQNLISLHIRKGLTKYAHEKYLSKMNFYRVATLSKAGEQVDVCNTSTPSGGAAKGTTSPSPFTAAMAPMPSSIVKLDNVELRIARDIQVFSDNVAFLYGHSFKPVLEFILSLFEASRDLGFQRPLLMFGFSAALNVFCKLFTPHLGKMVAKEAEVEGDFTQAHNRIAAHAEEIAFMDGGDTEKSIVNSKLEDVVTLKTWHILQRIKKSITDNLIKFSNMMVGGVFVHIPFLLSSDLPPEQRISQFRATEEIMLRCGISFTELIVLHRELQELGGYAGRITELFDALEYVDKQSADGTSSNVSSTDKPKSLGAHKGSYLTVSSSMNGMPDCMVDVMHGVYPSDKHLENGKVVSPLESCQRIASHINEVQHDSTCSTIKDGIKDGSSVIVFQNVTVVAPEEYSSYLNWRHKTEELISNNNQALVEPFSGRVLLDNLNLVIPHGKNVLVTGPNGAGKTSLFRTLAGLWQLASGTIVKPHSDDDALMLLPQKPYMVSGSLRDQITYPTLYKLRVRGRSNFDDNKNVKFVTDDEMLVVDERIRKVCVQAGVDNVVDNQPDGLDSINAWDSKLSGGERQKVAIARVLYHKPLFAVLDEATSAMHPENELMAYSALIEAGITVFSIAHRPALRSFHNLQLELDGSGGWNISDLTQNRTEAELENIKVVAANI